MDVSVQLALIMCYSHLILSVVLHPAQGKTRQYRVAEWRANEWSPCSQSCGPNARRHRRVWCYRRGRRVHNGLCFARRPTTVENCPAIDCPPEPYTFTECNKTCLHGSASVWGCRYTNSRGVEVGAGLSKCNITSKFISCTKTQPKKVKHGCPVFRYEPKPWSECSASCGSGIQAREFVCVRRRKFDKDVKFKKCRHLKEPVKERRCQVKPCPPVYEYEVGNWSACNTACGSGQEHRRVNCIQRWPNGTRSILGKHICAKEMEETVKSSQPCRVASGSCKWIQHTAGQKICSKGEPSYRLMSRCQNVERKAMVPDEFCQEAIGLKPPTISQPCYYVWKATSWGPCSTTCGGGRQRRLVTCRNHFPSEVRGQDQQVPSRHCDGFHKPIDEQKCNILPCPGTERNQPVDAIRLSSRRCHSDDPSCYSIRLRHPSLCHQTMFQKVCSCSCSEVLFRSLENSTA